MNIDIEALEAAAKAATPGPWVRGRYGGVHPDDECARGPCIVHARYDDNTSRPNAEANESFVVATDPKVVLGLLKRLRDAEGNHAASCIYCGEAIIYDTRKVDDMEAAHRMLMEHDRQCPKNPVAQEVAALKAHCRELRSALFAAGVEAARVAERMAERPGIGPADALRQPLLDIHDAAAAALRGYPAMSLAREQAGSQQSDATETAKTKATMLLELAREYRDMDVDADVIENLRARAGMELATVGIPLQVFEETQS